MSLDGQNRTTAKAPSPTQVFDDGTLIRDRAHTPAEQNVWQQPVAQPEGSSRAATSVGKLRGEWPPWSAGPVGALRGEVDVVVNDGDVIIDTDDSDDGDHDDAESPEMTQATLYLYAHRPPWSSSGLFRMVFSPLGVCLGYVAGEIYDEESASKRIPFSSNFMAWYRDRILNRRAQLEERYNAAIPFTIEWQQIDRRNKVMLANEIRRIECRYSIPVERLDRGLYVRSKLAMEVIIRDQSNRRHSFVPLPGFNWVEVEEALAATGLPTHRIGLPMWFFSLQRFLVPIVQIIGGAIWAIVIAGMLLAAPAGGGMLGLRAKLGFSVGFGIAVALVGAWKLASELRLAIQGE